MTDKRIFDDPNHPRYGPVRRLWVILVQLNLLEEGDICYPKGWDKACARLVAKGYPESAAQCAVLSFILENML